MRIDRKVTLLMLIISSNKLQVLCLNNLDMLCGCFCVATNAECMLHAIS